MLKTLRSTTKSVMIIVALCFVGMMVFAWGMDITGRRSRGVAQMDYVGSINGKKISYMNFNTIYDQRRQTMAEESRSSITAERQMLDQIWNEIVMQTLIGQEIQKRKISYTDNELISYMINNPVQGAVQAPIFQDANGSFSIEKYQQFILNPDNRKNPQSANVIQTIEQEARNSLPILKLQQRVVGGIIVPDQMVRQKWLEDNENRQVEFVYLTSLQAAGNAVIDPKEVETYYNGHMNDFKRADSRSLDLVFFPLTPTAQDSLDVLNRAKLIVDRAKKGEDFADLANGYTEDTGNKNPQGKGNGGELGWITHGQIVKEIEDAAFNMKPGDISEPILTRFGYHILKVDSLKFGGQITIAGSTAKPKPAKSGEVTSVKFRHILFRIEPSVVTRDAAENAANAFHTAVMKPGASFDAIAAQQKLQALKTPLFKKDDQYVPYIGGNSTLLADRVFLAKPGEVLPLYTVDNGFYVMSVAEVKSAGIPPLAEIRPMVEAECRKQLGAKLAADFATRVIDRMKGGMMFEAAVKADTVKTAPVQPQTVTRASNVPGIGARSPLIARAFELQTTTANGSILSAATSANEEGAGVIVLLNALPIDEAKFTSESDQIRQKLENDLQQEVITRYLDDLRKNAKIVDNRFHAYQL
jgi:peptidyl-prolyl cis-trans isomerase D